MKTATFYKYFTDCYFTLFLFIQFSSEEAKIQTVPLYKSLGRGLRDDFSGSLYWCTQVLYRCTHPCSHLFSVWPEPHVVVPRLRRFRSRETLASGHPATECAAELLAPRWAVTQWLICYLQVCLSPPGVCVARTDTSVQLRLQGKVLSSSLKEMHTKGSCLSLQE